MDQTEDLAAAFTAMMLLAMIDAKDEAEESEREEEIKAQEVAKRMKELDEETLRKFDIIRDFVSKHDDFWADFEDCD